MDNTARIIEVDFVNRRRKRMLPENSDLSRMAKHTEKYEAYRKKLEARKQAKAEMFQSCENVKNYVNTIIGENTITKKDVYEICVPVASLVLSTSVLACVLR